jgi:hypothetical protein
MELCKHRLKVVKYQSHTHVYAQVVLGAKQCHLSRCKATTAQAAAKHVVEAAGPTAQSTTALCFSLITQQQVISKVAASIW